MNAQKPVLKDKPGNECMSSLKDKYVVVAANESSNHIFL